MDIPEDPPEPLEPLDELKPLLHDGGDVGESCHMDDENAAVEYELTESGDSGNNNAMPSSEVIFIIYIGTITYKYSKHNIFMLSYRFSYSFFCYMNSY